MYTQCISALEPLVDLRDTAVNDIILAKMKTDTKPVPKIKDLKIKYQNHFSSNRAYQLLPILRTWALIKVPITTQR